MPVQRPGNVILVEDICCFTEREIILNLWYIPLSGRFVRKTASQFHFARGEITLQFVKEFPHVTGPIVVVKSFEDITRKRRSERWVPGVDLLLEEMGDQQRQILFAPSERGQIDRQHV